MIIVAMAKGVQETLHRWLAMGDDSRAVDGLWIPESGFDPDPVAFDALRDAGLSVEAMEAGSPKKIGTPGSRR
jgi:hypothetical protein